ncbi:MAG TPA: polysaccharide biosynthesis protein, partial [Allosphingosinicella sp.]|nr:polysaccharide biosynthesis protein [Allosphingosinicella sp.]
SVSDEFNPDGDIEIVTIGLRSGEKLYEELLIGENAMPTAHQRIMQAREGFLPRDRLETELVALKAAIEGDDAEAAIAILKHLVPEYRNSEPADEPPVDEAVEAPPEPARPRAEPLFKDPSLATPGS